MTDEKFYKTYPELSEFKEKIVLLQEEPEKEDTKKIENNKFKENINIYTKKFIVIQNGCDNYCSFCLTIHKRGKSQNIDAKEIIAEINDFVETGGKEIVITGVNLASRGCTNTRLPQENKFAELLQKILDETKIERIRISSLGPEFLNEQFFEIIKNQRFLPHFHISIQSFSDKVLKLMNRNYNKDLLDDVINKLKNLDRPDKEQISIGADIIVGFPGETEQDFQETIDGIIRHKINKVHAFPFSAHTKGESVPARTLQNQISPETKKKREKKLKEISDKIRDDFIKKNTGTKHQVLIEEKKNGVWRGWTGNYIQVELKGEYKKGQIVGVEGNPSLGGSCSSVVGGCWRLLEIKPPPSPS
ncbi:MAG TPA: radical SAM protein [Candidatus Absconditabacterales bacterium]|nr:radical SAM protein [Candidatus Absconditabacterales bacterium]